MFNSLFLSGDGINILADKVSLNDNSEYVEPYAEKINLDDKIKKVRGELEGYTNIWDWDEEVDLINIARVEFTGYKSSKRADTILMKESKSLERLDTRQDKTSCTTTRQLRLSELL